MQPEAGPRTWQTAERVLQKGSSLFRGLSAESALGSHLAPSGWPEKRFRNAPSHATRGRLLESQPVTPHSGGGASGQMEALLLEQSILERCRTAALLLSDDRQTERGPVVQ